MALVEKSFPVTDIRPESKSSSSPKNKNRQLYRLLRDYHKGKITEKEFFAAGEKITAR